MTKFCHLHLHTTYSLLDSTIKPKQAAEYAAKNNMPAIAMTDHGNMIGAIKFYKECKRAGVKPIIGMEAYIEKKATDESVGRKNYHLVLLAKNNEGYKNLLKIASFGYTKNLHYKPVLTKEFLTAHSRGLIGMSACISGEIPRTLMNLGEEAAARIAKEYIRIFGKENFYIEIMDTGVPGQGNINDSLKNIAGGLGLRMTATNDVHYLNPEDSKAHQVLVCIGYKKLLSDKNRPWSEELKAHFRTYDEMVALLPGFGDAIHNTVEIAEQCNVTLDLGKYHMPKFFLKNEKNPEEHLKDMSKKGLARRIALYKERGIEIDKKEYQDRLEYELGAIIKTGFVDYFLVVWDFVLWAKRNKITTSPGRGSVGGSLVAYSLGITDIDPIKYNLLFERFINPSRVSPPDIDSDFEKDKRDLVLKYLVDRYGENKVCQISTSHQLKSKIVIRDVGRVLGYDYKFVDTIAKLIPDPVMGVNIEIKDAIENEPHLKKLYNEDKDVKAIIDIALKLEGLIRHIGTHAGGVVISDTELDDYTPLYKRSEAEEITTQYTMEDVEDVGLIKFDLLGLKTLSVVAQTISIVDDPGIRFMRDIPMNDEDTFKLLSEGDTTGVFQMSSSGIRDLLKRVKPTKLEDLAAVNALYRPGPLQAGITEKYVQRKNGIMPVEYLHPSLEEPLRETYGLMVFQEQIMKIAEIIAGFTLSEADSLRKAIGKKKPEEMKALKKGFIDGCVKEEKITKDTAKQLFKDIKGFSDYGFNKSHAIGYSLLAYYTAYLKAHYPVEFLATLMSYDDSNTDKIALYISEGKAAGIKILPPDINLSKKQFTVVSEETSLSGKAIRFGLTGIKGVGEAASDAILEARDKPFISLFDFCHRVSSKARNKGVLEKLVRSGAFDKIAEENLVHRAQVFNTIEKAANIKPKKKASVNQLSLSLFVEEGTAIIDTNVNIYEDAPLYSREELLEQEKETIGHYLSYHPMEEYQVYVNKIKPLTCNDILNGATETNISMIGVVAKTKKKQNKKTKSRYAIVSISDLTGQIDAFIPPKILSKIELKLDKAVAGSRVVLIRGTTEERRKEVDGEEHVSASKVIIFDLDILDPPPKASQTLKSGPEATFKDFHVYLDMDSSDPPKMAILKETLDKYKGEYDIIVHMVIPGQSVSIMTLGEDLRVNARDINLQKELYSLFPNCKLLIQEKANNS